MSGFVERGAPAFRALLLGSTCLFGQSALAGQVETCVGLSLSTCNMTPLESAGQVEAFYRNGVLQVLVTGWERTTFKLWVNGAPTVAPLDFYSSWISPDGALLVGRIGPVAAWWRPSENAFRQLITPAESAQTKAYSASDDGRLIAGSSGDSFLSNFKPLSWSWNAAKGSYDAPVNLPLLTNQVWGEAYGVSGNGQTVIGYSATATYANTATRWTREGTGWKAQSLGVTGSSTAAGVDFYGNTIVGYYQSSHDADDSSAFIWKNGSGWSDLGSLGAPGDNTWANAVSADGRIVVGASANIAFRWTEATGMKDLNLLLKDAGVKMGTIRLNEAYYISRNGEWILALDADAKYKDPTAKYKYVIRYADGLGSFGVATPESLRASASELARRRTGSMAQMQGHAAPLINLPYRFLAAGPAQSSLGTFASVGSASGGLTTRWSNGAGLTLRGGLAALTADSPGIDLRSAFMVAGEANYVFGNLGGVSPFVAAGGFIAPNASLALKRSYMNGADTVTARGRTTGAYSYISASLGAAFDMGKDTQGALSVEVGRYGLNSGAYAETAGAANPFNAAMSSGSDSMRAVKFGAQITHQLNDDFDLGLRAALARGAKSTSDVQVAVAGVGASAGEGKASNWLEYGARLGYRIDKRMTVDGFLNGVAGDETTGQRLHAGLGLRVNF